MSHLFHRLSAVLFYVIGSSFFVAYLLLRNQILGTWPAWWLQTADLPFALCALLYAGLSLYVSVQDPKKPSKTVPWVIGVPLAVIFLLLVVLNFWGASGR